MKDVAWITASVVLVVVASLIIASAWQDRAPAEVEHAIRVAQIPAALPSLGQPAMQAQPRVTLELPTAPRTAQGGWAVEVVRGQTIEQIRYQDADAKTVSP